MKSCVRAANIIPVVHLRYTYTLVLSAYVYHLQELLATFAQADLGHFRVPVGLVAVRGNARWRKMLRKQISWPEDARFCCSFGIRSVSGRWAEGF